MKFLFAHSTDCWRSKSKNPQKILCKNVVDYFDDDDILFMLSNIIKYMQCTVL